MSWVKEIINDTLKREHNGKLRWSRTSLTMLTAWITVLWSYIHYTLKDGFNETAFFGLLGVALGAKITDSWSKKLHNDKSTNSEEIPK